MFYVSYFLFLNILADPRSINYYAVDCTVVFLNLVFCILPYPPVGIVMGHAAHSPVAWKASANDERQMRDRRAEGRISTGELSMIMCHGGCLPGLGVGGLTRGGGTDSLADRAFCSSDRGWPSTRSSRSKQAGIEQHATWRTGPPGRIVKGSGKRVCLSITRAQRVEARTPQPTRHSFSFWCDRRAPWMFSHSPFLAPYKQWAAKLFAGHQCCCPGGGSQ